jgi:hypothetical protein
VIASSVPNCQGLKVTTVMGSSRFRRTATTKFFMEVLPDPQSPRKREDSAVRAAIVVDESGKRFRESLAVEQIFFRLGDRDVCRERRLPRFFTKYNVPAAGRRS